MPVNASAVQMGADDVSRCLTSRRTVMANNKGCGCFLIVLVIVGFIAAVLLYSKNKDIKTLEPFREGEPVHTVK